MTNDANARPTVLRASWLFDGITGTLLADPVVVVDHGVIVSVEQGRPPPLRATVVDLPGATLLPGLVDTHVHLAFDASPDPVGALAARDDVEALAAMRAAAAAAAHGGVTTVRDLGDRGYLSIKLRDENAADLPTILAAGPPITSAGGHCHFLGGVAEPGPDGMGAAVREHAERGVDVIKLMASGGTMTPGTRQELAQFARADLRAAVEEAHRLGLPVTAHAHGTGAIADAVAAGVDGIEHASFWSADGVDDPPPELVAALVAAGTVVGLTAGLVMLPGMMPPPEILSRMPAMLANSAALHHAGARMVVGTDAGIAPPKPPDVLRYAVAELTGLLSLSPAAALRRVTADAADAIGLGRRKGRLAPGYDADVLAVDGDVLADLGVLHHIRAVFARGTPVR